MYEAADTADFTGTCLVDGHLVCYSSTNQAHHSYESCVAAVGFAAWVLTVISTIFGA